MPSTPAHERARLAASKRWHGDDAPETTAARRDLAAAKLGAYIEKVVAAAPALTPAQIDELSLLFHGTSKDGRARQADPAEGAA